MSDEAIIFHHDEYPIITVTLVREPTMDEFRAHLAEWDRILAKGQRVSFVYNVPAHVPSPSEQRLLQSEWIRRNYTLLNKTIAGGAFSIPAPLTQVILRAIFIFSPPPYPYTVTSSMAEAKDWCREMLAKKAARAS